MRKLTKSFVIVCVTAARCSAVQSFVDFDAIDASGTSDGVAGAVVTDYFADFGISVTGAEPRVYDTHTLVQNDVEFTVPTSLPNFLAAGQPSTMTFTFDGSLSGLDFSRIGWRKSGPFGWSIPEWTATAYDGLGNVVDQVGEPFLQNPPDLVIPSADFSLVSPEIQSVTFFSTGFGLGGWSSINVDDFVLTWNPIDVLIDIKPDSEQNTFNNDGNGVVPVTILGSDSFDVTQIDLSTVELDSLGIKSAGKSGNLLAHLTDVNDDSFDDYLLQIEDSEVVYEIGEWTATLTGSLLNGFEIVGTDLINVIPNGANVPEPSTMALATAFAALAVCRRRRK